MQGTRIDYYLVE